jgi:hypothetical protein
LESQVLDLTEELDEDWVEVDTDEALLGEWSLLSVEKGLVQLVLGVSLDAFLPLLDLLLIVLLQVVAKRRVELLDILELLAVLN